MIAHALDAAWTRGSERMGDDPDAWRWGRLHTLTLTNQSFGESGIAPDRMALQPRTVRARRRLVDRERHRLGRHAWATASTGCRRMRMVVDLADLDDSRWINLTGASGHAFNPHYDDQAPLWQRGETRPWPFTLEAVQDAATETLRLRPVSGG